jgi:hypothetical protein
MPSSRLLFLAAAALFLAAPLAARAADSCGILSIQQISAATQDPSIKSGSGMNGDCIWSGKKTTVYISVRDSGTWSTAKGAYQKYGKIESVSGVGSDAFFMGPDDPKPTLYALKGAHFIILRVNGTGFSNQQTKAALKTLANQALAGL